MFRLELALSSISNQCSTLSLLFLRAASLKMVRNSQRLPMASIPETLGVRAFWCECRWVFSNPREDARALCFETWRVQLVQHPFVGHLSRHRKHVVVFSFGFALNLNQPLLGPPVVPFYPFLGEGSPTKIDYRKRLVPLF